MKKVAVITDSLACLTREQVEHYGIGIVPINFYSNGSVYRDWIDITPSEAYELFLKDPRAFKTSAASPDDFFNACREASQITDEILFVTVSSKLSTTYNSALIAKERAKTELPNTSIEIIDSRLAAAAEGFVTLAVARVAEMGRGLAEAVKAAEQIKEKVRLLILLDTIRYVYRSGRIPKVAAHAASMLNIRPILSVSSPSGAVRFVGAARSRTEGVNRLLKMMRHRVGGKPVHVAVTHAYAPEAAEELKKTVATEFNCAELWLTEFSPVMGYSCGTGTLGLAFYPE